jgi:hypothetical protein
MRNNIRASVGIITGLQLQLLTVMHVVDSMGDLEMAQLGRHRSGYTHSIRRPEEQQLTLEASMAVGLHKIGCTSS